MIACHGRVQQESGVVHVITERLDDLSSLLCSVGERDAPFPMRHGRGDGATHPGSPDRGDLDAGEPLGRKARDTYVRDGMLGPGTHHPSV